MVITCEQCDTRFQLDDERIPTKGAKVRCSRCRHAFFVKPPASRGDPIASAVDDALREEVDQTAHGSTQELNPAAALSPDGLGPDVGGALEEVAPVAADLDAALAEDDLGAAAGDVGTPDDLGDASDLEIDDPVEAALDEAPSPDDLAEDSVTDDVPDAGTDGLSVTDDVPDAGTDGLSVTDDVPDAGTDGLSVTDDVPDAGTDGLSVTDDVPDAGTDGLSADAGFDISNDDLPENEDWTFNTDSVEDSTFDDPGELSASFAGPSALSRPTPVDFGLETGLATGDDAAPVEDGIESGAGLDAASEAIDDLLSGNDADEAAALESESDVDEDIDALLDAAPADSSFDSGLDSDSDFESELDSDLTEDDSQDAAHADIDAQLADFEVDEAPDGEVFDQPAADLGSPENWDFFDQPGAGPEAQASGATATAPLVAPAAAPLETAGMPHPPISVDAGDTTRSAHLDRLANIGGAVTVALLLVLGLVVGLGQRAPEASVAPMSVALAGLEAADVDGRWVDNVAAGPIYVVSGTLRNSGERPLEPESRFVVRLLDASGDILTEDAATLGPALPADRLREEPPSTLRGELEAGAARWAWSTLAGGSERRLEAVLTRVPAAAVGFDLVAEPVARPTADSAAAPRVADPEGGAGI